MAIKAAIIHIFIVTTEEMTMCNGNRAARSDESTETKSRLCSSLQLSELFSIY